MLLPGRFLKTYLQVRPWTTIFLLPSDPGFFPSPRGRRTLFPFILTTIFNRADEQEQQSTHLAILKCSFREVWDSTDLMSCRASKANTESRESLPCPSPTSYHTCSSASSLILLWSFSICWHPSSPCSAAPAACLKQCCSPVILRLLCCPFAFMHLLAASVALTPRSPHPDPTPPTWVV